MKDWKAPTPKIGAVVTVVHALLLGLLLTCAFVRQRDSSGEEMLLGDEIPVGLDDAAVAALNLPPAPEPPAPDPTPEPPAPAPEPPKPDPPPAPPPPDPEPPKPDPLPEPPPVPDPPKPKPEPVPEPVLKPAPAKVVVPKPEPKPEPPKPKVEPPPKPVTPPKPEPKVEKPPPKRYRTAEEIRRSANLQPAKPSRPVKPVAAFDPSRIASSLQRGLPAVSIDSKPSSGRPGSPTGSTTGSLAGKPGNGDDEQRWHAALSAELYRLWAQPTRSEAGGGNPTVRVSLKIAGDGQVLEARVVGPSRIMAMDATIQELLAALKKVPGPKAYGLDGGTRTITVTFRLTT